ncbi:MAG TPA: UPF0182 family protein [Geobacteraceae bacterium]|nr:UPF0182 family protein [Geobacteraceae bacterium]
MPGRKVVLITLAIVFLVLPALASLLNLYTDWNFFAETGYASVLTTTLLAKIGSGLLFGGFLLAFLLANLVPALRLKFARAAVTLVKGTIHHVKTEDIEFLIKPLSLVAVLALTLFAGHWGSLQWEKLLLFRNMLTVGTPDPILGKDIGFYFFRLPFLETLVAYARIVALLGIGATGVIYYLKGGVSLTPKGLQINTKVRKHLALLAGFFLMVVAAGFYLDGFKLLFSENGTLYGAGYTDVTARLRVYRFLVVITPLAGVILAAGIWKARWRQALLVPLVIGAVYGVGVKAYPTLMQKFKVAPNELALEMPYIEHGITFTRLGYNLDKIETIPFDVDDKLNAASIAANEPTIKNIRLWDHAPLLRTYAQLQQIRTYYKFHDVDNDRYLVNGNYTQVMLSPRELSYNDLPSRNWINERLIFTHGNGITFGPVSRISKEGLPEFFIKDIPAVSLADIEVTRPEIYYGEMSNDYVIVKTRVPEFGYPTETGNINTTYEGKGGVALDSLVRRALFAARFKTEKILLSSDISKESRILYYRNIVERAKTLAPFLLLDSDPYMVVTKDGRLTWIIDAYTASGFLPYSKPVSRGINYMRNSVKIVVDAYDGTLDFYISDPKDPLVKVYTRIFPKLLKPLAAMPEDLRAHIRYPHQFMRIQASMFTAYHMTDPKVFYNKENLWEVPALGESPMEPYYTIMKLPGEKKEEYILLLPFTPAKRDNLAAWLTARCDGPNYGKLLVYTFPRDRLIYGPKQIDARINQDSVISQQLTLWGQRGSEVIRGSMLVIPIEKSLLYVQPLYLAATDKIGLPELQRVIVAYRDEVVMEETLELALKKLFGGSQAAAEPVGETGPSPAAGQNMLAAEAMKVYERAIAMQRQGNWAGYGEQLKKLKEILQRMARK